MRFPSERSLGEMQEDLNRKLPELVELLDGRLALEPFFARRAASKRTPEHLKVLKESVKSLKKAAEVLQSTEKLIADENLLPQVKRPIEKERERARLKYRRADNRLHHTISVAARNSYLLDKFTTLRAKFFTFPGIDLVIEHGKGNEDGKTRFDQVIEEHEAIIQVIEKHDKDAAEALMKDHVKSTKTALSGFVENKLEKRLVSLVNVVDKQKVSPDEAAKIVSEALSDTRVFALVRDSNVNTASITEGNDVFHYISKGPNEEKQFMVPVFTRRDFIQDALNRYSDWQGLSPQSVLELKGEELLRKLDPDVEVIINPWTSLEFQFPVGWA